MNRFSSKGSRRLRGVILGLVLAALPIVAVATDTFSDVPTTSAAHEPVNKIAAAGLTRGCNAENTLYCPTTAVNRGQMASFLSRAAGRIAYSGNGAAPAAVAVDPGTELGALTLSAGGIVDGATNFFKADASFSVVCSAACSVDINISDGTDSSRVLTVTMDAAGEEHGSLTWANDVGAATDATLTLTAVAAVADTATATGELTAIYAPFGADGGDTLDPAP